MLRRKSSTFRRLHRYASHVVEADREHESVSESPSAVLVLARLRPQDLERAAHQPTQHHHRHRRHIVICARNNLLGGRGLRNPERSDSQLHQREDRHSSPGGKELPYMTSAQKARRSKQCTLAAQSYKWYGMDAQDVVIVKIPIIR